MHILVEHILEEDSLAEKEHSLAEEEHSLAEEVLADTRVVCLYQLVGRYKEGQDR